MSLTSSPRREATIEDNGNAIDGSPSQLERAESWAKASDDSELDRRNSVDRRREHARYDLGVNISEVMCGRRGIGGHLITTKPSRILPPGGRLRESC
jgi:hypothetical protein